MLNYLLLFFAQKIGNPIPILKPASMYEKEQCLRKMSTLLREMSFFYSPPHDIIIVVGSYTKLGLKTLKIKMR